MKLAAFAFTRHGCEIAIRVRDCLCPTGRLYAPEKYLQEGFLPYTPPLNRFMEPVFSWADQIVFVSSCGIAVRAIAPFVKDKKLDPGVTVVDEQGTVVIPILSGHIGGANALARHLANALGAQAVLTTATDVNGRFSVDTWASERGLAISDMKMAKEVSAAILERDLPLVCEFPVLVEYPTGTYPADTGELGISVGIHKSEPFEKTLRLTPKILHLGLGCRSGIAEEKIAAAVDAVLEENSIDPAAISCAASITLKEHEAGLLAFAEKRGLPLRFYDAETLKAVPGSFTGSEFVRSVTGVESVCERAAMIGAERLIVKKTAKDGVTVALAAEHWEAEF